MSHDPFRNREHFEREVDQARAWQRLVDESSKILAAARVHDDLTRLQQVRDMARRHVDEYNRRSRLYDELYFRRTANHVSLAAPRRSRNSRPALVQPPGSFVLAISEFVISAKSRDRVIVPMIGDMRDEYFEALSDERPWLARTILARWRLRVLVVVLGSLPIAALLRWLGFAPAVGGVPKE